MLANLPVTKNAPLHADRPHASPKPDANAIRHYFAEAQDDYFAWSRGHNLHFGYFAGDVNPFDREAMLERMNRHVIGLLKLDPKGAPVVADLGCGSGATARALVRSHPNASVTGVTLVHEQITLGCRLNAKEGLHRRIGYLLGDFADTGLASASHDAVMFVESLCYGAGEGRDEALREALRLLKPGGRLAIVDGFLRGSREPTGLTGAIHRGWCDGWAIPSLASIDAVKATLERLGFVDVEVRSSWWRIVPSAMHIPWVATLHTIRECRRHGLRLTAWRWKHIRASWLSIALGLCVHAFGHYTVTARRREAS